jgi:hypothetical protein
MTHKGFTQDTFEQLLELGQSTAKQTVKSVTSTFNPLAPVLEKGTSSQDTQGQAKEQMEKMKKEGNSTPLDFDNLQKKYENQDKAKHDALKNRLFQLVKSGEEQVMMENKKQVEEKKREEVYLEQEKKKKQHEAQAQQTDEPQGKERKSVLGKRSKKANIAMEKQAEFKAGGTKN